MSVEWGRRVLRVVTRSIRSPRARFWVPPAAVAMLIAARLACLRDADAGLSTMVAGWGTGPARDRVALVAQIDSGTIAIALFALVVGLSFVGLRSLRSGIGDPLDATRTGRPSARFVFGVVGLAVLLGHLTTRTQLATGFGRFASWGLGRDVTMPMSVVWAVSWLLTFAMGACLTSDRAADGSRASARLRTLLVANALFVALASAITVASFDAAAATLRSEGCWFAKWDPALDAMRRSTAGFYVLVLAAKYVPAKAILEAQARQRRSSSVAGEARDPNEPRLVRFAVDVAAILAPAFAEVLTRLAT